MRTRTPFALLMLATLAAYGTPAPAQSRSAAGAYDHYDPVVLNESAVAAVQKGDYATAWILLERASRLAPHDQRIARNLALLRAYREGSRPTGESAPSPHDLDHKAGSGSEVGDLLREPPPIWTTSQH